MLFSGLGRHLYLDFTNYPSVDSDIPHSFVACFSPSVTPTIRKLWGTQKNHLFRSKRRSLNYFFLTVKNGGTLTHTDDDFRRANYFFCDGMDDPWLNEYVVGN